MNRYKYLKQMEKNILKLSEETPRDDLEIMFEAVKKAQEIHKKDTHKPSIANPSLWASLKMIDVLYKANVPLSVNNKRHVQ